MSNFNITVNGDPTEQIKSTIGENVSKGDILYLHSDSKWYKATAAILDKSSTELSIATVNAIINDEIELVTFGGFNYTLGTLVAGSKYYLATTPGGITTTLYVNTANIIRYIGTAYSDEILIFNPDQTYISENGGKINNVPLNVQLKPHTHTESDISDLDKYTTQQVDDKLLQKTDEEDFLLHKNGDGSDHTFIDQDVTVESSPTFNGGVTIGPDGQPITWNDKHHTINIPTGKGTIVKPTSDVVFEVHNGTGELLKRGTVVYPDGTSTNGVSNVQKAIANSHETIETQLGVISWNIEDGDDGHVMISGILDDIDTTNAGVLGPVWLSETIPGLYTTVKPEFPNYAVLVGNVDKVGVDGEFTVDSSFSISDTFDNFFNGTIRESFTFEITSDGTSIIGSLYPKGTQPNLTMVFSDGFTTLPPTTISGIFPGQSINPQSAFVFITRANKVLEVSASGFPLEEHIKIANVLVQTAADVQADGPLKNQNFNDHIQGGNGQGHKSHVTERLRLEGAKWVSGTKLSATANGASSLVSTTGGIVYQLHRHAWDSFDMATGSHLHVVNNVDFPYVQSSDLNDQDEDALGNSLKNSSFSLVFWGSINSGNAEDKMMCNLPTGSYAKNSPELAVSDAYNYSVYTIPTDFVGTGFLIARVTYIRQSNGDWSVYDVQDLTDRAAVGGGGGSGGTGVTTFAGLTDTPNSYVGSEDYEVVVGASGQGLEYKPPTIHTFVYEQSTPSTIWSITHPMSKYPSVTVVDSAGTRVEGSVTYTDLNNLIITFNAGFSGTATLN